MNDAVARRSFAVAGPARGVPQAIYDRIAPRLYATLRAIGPAAIRSGALGFGSALGSDAEGIRSSPRGKAFVSAVNGLVGDTLARRNNGLALRMTLRADGGTVSPTEAELAAAFPDASGRIVVFVHGFGESDDSWRWYSSAHWGAAGLSYGELMRRGLAFTPLYLHYNSGRSVSANAIEFSGLLEELTTHWPGWVEEIVLVGHSAGTSVARGALRHGHLSGAAWVARVSYLFALGTPRTVRAAERTAQRASQTLGRLPETRPLSDLIESRSAGLKDLAEESANAAAPEHVTLVTLTGEQSGIGHFKLLNHPDIYRELTTRLSARTAPVRARAVPEGRYGRAAMALRERTLSRRRSP